MSAAWVSFLYVVVFFLLCTVASGYGHYQSRDPGGYFWQMSGNSVDGLWADISEIMKVYTVILFYVEIY